jgi:hypothetical protein
VGPALKDVATGLCLSMLGTNSWVLVGFALWRLFVDGLLFGAHIQERLSPVRGSQNWGEDCTRLNFIILNFDFQWGD